MAVGDRIEDKIEKLEEDILMKTKKSHLNEIIGLRGEILMLKKMLVPQRDVVGVLHRKELRLISNELQKYFGDIYENAVKSVDTFDTLRDLMGNLREAYQASVANRANEIMRIFTALTTIFMPLTFITGVFGMNFDNIAGLLHIPHMDEFMLGFMIVIGIFMMILFKKKEWL